MPRILRDLERRFCRRFVRRLLQPSVGGRRGHTQALRRFTDAEAPHRCNNRFSDFACRPTQATSLPASTFDASFHTLGNPRSLELRNRAEDVKLQTPCWRAGVDALPEADERDPERREFIERENQVPQVATETIQSPHNQDIQPAASGVLQQRSSAGRDSFAPETPSSTYSVTVQPRASA
jgi:hypothetical protein